MTRIILADSRPEVRAALRLVIELRGGCQITAEAASGVDVFMLTAHGCADVIFMDVDLPGLPGARDQSQRRPLRAMIETLNLLCPGVRVIAMSSRPDARAEAIAARADGFLCKSDPPEMLHTLLNELFENSKSEREP